MTLKCDANIRTAICDRPDELEGKCGVPEGDNPVCARLCRRWTRLAAFAIEQGASVQFVSVSDEIANDIINDRLSRTMEHGKMQSIGW